MLSGKSFLYIFLLCTMVSMICLPAKKAFASGQDSTSQFPAYKGWVNDFEALYTKAEVHVLDSMISVYNKESGIEMTIATLGSDYCNSDDFVKYTMDLANYWGVGQKGKDNGILIGISTVFRTMRINTGYGIERQVSDEETKQIIETYFLPSFKEGVYYKGTLNGLNALIELLRTKKWE